jgi:uncharacterized protein with HEPN domain
MCGIDRPGGERTEQAGSSLDREFPDLNLSLAYKSRNKLGYFAVEQEIVWNTVTVSIPKTVAAARQAKLKHDGGL